MFSVTSPATRAEDAAKLEEVERMRLANENTRNQQQQQQQNEFAQRFGRGLTSGGASTLGRAGQKTNVPAGAIQPHAMGNTYWEENREGPNRVEQAGILSRQADEYQKALSGGNQEYLSRAEKALIDAYNSSDKSSPSDVVSIKRDGKGGMQFIREDGTPVNKTPVTADDLRNIGGNQLTGQNVYQRASGGGMGTGTQTSPAQNKMLGDAAKFASNKEYMTAKEELDALINPSTDLGSLANQMKPEERALAITQAKQRLDDVTRMGGQRIAQSGMQGGQVGGRDSITSAKQLISDLVAKGHTRDEVLQEVWSRTGDRNLMQLAERSLTDVPDEKVSGMPKREPTPEKPAPKPTPKEQPKVQPKRQPAPRKAPTEKKEVKPTGMPKREAAKATVPKRDVSKSVGGKVIDSYKDTNILGGTIRSDLGFKPTVSQIKLAEKVRTNPDMYSKELQDNANTVLKIRNRDQYKKRTGSGQMGRAR